MINTSAILNFTGMCGHGLQNSEQMTLLTKPWKVRCRPLWKEQHSFYCSKLQK